MYLQLLGTSSTFIYCIIMQTVSSAALPIRKDLSQLNLANLESKFHGLKLPGSILKEVVLEGEMESSLSFVGA